MLVNEKIKDVVGSSSKVVSMKDSLGVGRINVDVSGILVLGSGGNEDKIVGSSVRSTLLSVVDGETTDRGMDDEGKSSILDPIVNVREGKTDVVGGVSAGTEDCTENIVERTGIDVPRTDLIGDIDRESTEASGAIVNA